MAVQPDTSRPRHLRLAEIALLTLPALLLIALALHLRSEEIARRDVKRAIVGKWRREDQDHAIVVYNVQGDQLLMNYNGYHLPDKRISYKFIDDNHFQIMDSHVPQLHLIGEVTIHGDKMRITDNERPPKVVNYTRIKDSSSK